MYTLLMFSVTFPDGIMTTIWKSFYDSARAFNHLSARLWPDEVARNPMSKGDTCLNLTATYTRGYNRQQIFYLQIA